MIKHRSPISGIDTFGDQYVATAGYDSQLILWDLPMKRSLARAQHDHLVNLCHFSPGGDLIATASSDYSARIWSVPSLRLVGLLAGHEDDVEMATFSPDGTRVATASRDHTARIWDLSGREQARLVGHVGDVNVVEWLRGGCELVTSADDGTVRRWQPDGRLLQTIDLGGGDADTVAFAEDGTLLAGNHEGEIVVITDSGIRRVHAHRGGLKKLVYEPSQRVLVSTSYDRTFKIWSVEADGELRLTRTVEVPACIWMRACAFAGRSRIVWGTFGTSYATYDLDAQAWNLSGVEQTPGINAVRVVDGAVYTVGDAGVVRRDGELFGAVGSLCNFLGEIGGRVVTGGQMGTLFDARTGEALYQHWSPLNCSVTFIRRGAPHLVVGAYTGEGIVFRQREDGSLENIATLKMNDNAIKGLACNQTHIFSVDASGPVAFHEIDSLECTRHVTDGHEKVSNGAVSLPDGRFVTVSRDLTLRLWSSDSAEVVRTPHHHSVKCVAASPGGNLVATGAYDGTVALYDWRCGRWVHRERPTAFGISSITPAETPDEFLASSYDGEVYRVSAP